MGILNEEKTLASWAGWSSAIFHPRTQNGIQFKLKIIYFWYLPTVWLLSSLGETIGKRGLLCKAF